MRIGLIAGTGMARVVPAGDWREAQTPYGAAALAEIGIGGRDVVLLRRHGPKANIPPHLINYRANLRAMKDAGVDRIIATAAVGSLHEDIPAGSMAVIGDFIDFTKRRENTCFDVPGQEVVHTDFTMPYCPVVSSELERAAFEAGVPLGRRVTYVCVDGPRYETPAEIRMFAQLGGDVVGMTGVPEVVLAREMGMCYGAMAIVTRKSVV